MSEISKLIAEIKSEGILRAGKKLENLYLLAEQMETDYAALQQKLDSESLEKDYNADQIIYWKEQAGLLKQKLDAIGQSAQWKPEICPITRRPFFMWIEHPSDGMVPTYGGPLDSYTIPVLDIDGEFCCERFDHDEGCWVDSECVGVRLTNDQEPVIDTAYLNSVRAEGVQILTSRLQTLIDEGVFDAKEIGVAAGAVYEGAQIAANLRSGTHDTAREGE